MKTPFIINSYLNLIQLALTMPVPGTKCIVAGWGYLEEVIEHDSKLISTTADIYY